MVFILTFVCMTIKTSNFSGIITLCMQLLSYVTSFIAPLEYAVFRWLLVQISWFLILSPNHVKYSFLALDSKGPCPQRQQEHVKHKRVLWAKQQLCMCITLFCTFLCHPYTTTEFWFDLRMATWSKVINFIISLWTQMHSFALQFQPNFSTFK